MVRGDSHAIPGADARRYLASSEFCGACHDVRLFGTDALAGPRGGEHFKRLRNAYSEWAAWADDERRAGRAPATCQDCHMSLYPGVCVPSPDAPAPTTARATAAEPRMSARHRVRAAPARQLRARSLVGRLRGVARHRALLLRRRPPARARLRSRRARRPDPRRGRHPAGRAPAPRPPARAHVSPRPRSTGPERRDGSRSRWWSRTSAPATASRPASARSASSGST